MTNFAEALRQVEERDILDACRGARLGQDETAYILGRFRSGSFSREILTAIGGTSAEWVSMMLEARTPHPEPMFRFR